jgi:hypothetical protein
VDSIPHRLSIRIRKAVSSPAISSPVSLRSCGHAESTNLCSKFFEALAVSRISNAEDKSCLPDRISMGIDRSTSRD